MCIRRSVSSAYISKDYVPPHVFDYIHEFANGYECKFYSDDECISIIKDNFEPKVLEKYNSIKGGAHRADLFRYCILYLEGGVYLDIKMIPKKSIDQMFIRKDCMYSTLSAVKGTIFNGTIATPPKNHFFMELINNVCATPIGDFDRDYNVLTIQFYNKIQEHTIDGPPHLGLNKGSVGNLDVILFEESCDNNTMQCGGHTDRYGNCCTIKNKDGDVLFLTRYSNFPWGKFALVITMHNTPDREKMYNEVVKYYTNRIPKKCLYIIDSSNNGMDSHIIPIENQIVFDQKQHCNNGNSSTDMEICSLIKVKEKFDTTKFDSIFKLTGKYKVPEIENLTPHFNSDIVIQSSGYNTELIGFKSEKFNDILNSLKTKTGILEERMTLMKNEFTTSHFPKLNIVGPYYKRADGLKLTNL